MRKMICTGLSLLALGVVVAGTLIDIPPDTRHSIKNTGEGALKYICLAAPTRNASVK